GERLLGVAAPAAGVAVDVDVGEKAHLHPDAALSGTRLAAPPGDVEREPPGGPAAETCVRDLREEAADVVEEADVGRRGRARRAAHRRLVHLDPPHAMLHSLTP